MRVILTEELRDGIVVLVARFPRYAVSRRDLTGAVLLAVWQVIVAVALQSCMMETNQNGKMNDMIKTKQF